MTTPVIDPGAVTLRIRTIVENEGTTSVVAKKCGIKPDTLFSIINGKAMPNATTLAHLSQGLEVDAHWILFGKVFADG
jgi:transcriptional regulator with XRE-family HTH domain